jgi:hypothetical protein
MILRQVPALVGRHLALAWILTVASDFPVIRDLVVDLTGQGGQASLTMLARVA